MSKQKVSEVTIERLIIPGGAIAQKVWEKALAELRMYEWFEDAWDEVDKQAQQEVRDHLVAFIGGHHQVEPAKSTRPQAYTRNELGEAIKNYSPGFELDAPHWRWPMETQGVAMYAFLNYDLYSQHAWTLRLALVDLAETGTFRRMSDIGDPEPAPTRQSCRGCYDPEYTHASDCPSGDRPSGSAK